MLDGLGDGREESLSTWEGPHAPSWGPSPTHAWPQEGSEIWKKANKGEEIANLVSKAEGLSCYPSPHQGNLGGSQKTGRWRLGQTSPVDTQVKGYDQD